MYLVNKEYYISILNNKITNVTFIIIFNKSVIEQYQNEIASERVQHHMAGSCKKQTRGFYDTDAS